MPHLSREWPRLEDFRHARLWEGAPQLVVGHQVAALQAGELARGRPITESEDTWRAAVELQRSRRLGLVMNGRMLVEDGMLL
jgi:putative intracellular protease/amidase